VSAPIDYVDAPKNGSQHRDWLDWLPELYGKEDKFFITLEKAKPSLL